MQTSYALPPPNPELSQKKRKRKSKTATATTTKNKEIHSIGIKDDEERALEELIFGGDAPGTLDNVLAKAGKELENNVKKATLNVHDNEDDEELLFTIDTRGDDVLIEKSNEDPTIEEKAFKPTTCIHSSLETNASKPVWKDDDDFSIDIANKGRLRKLRKTEPENVLSSTEYEARLRSHFEKFHPRPKWADAIADSVNEKDEENEINFLKTTTSITLNNTITPDALSLTRLKDGNQMGYSHCVIQSVQFHPKTPIILTAGYDKSLRLFRIDGKINPKIQSVWFQNMPIHHAKYTVDGKQIIITGAKKHFYTYDMDKGSCQKIFGIRGRTEKSLSKFELSPCNRYLAFVGESGYIILVSRETKQWIANLRLNGIVKSLCFSYDGEYLYAVGNDDEIYQFETRSRQCISKVKDIGSFKTSTISISPDDKYLATGLKSGIVNIYNRKDIFNSNTSSSSSISPMKLLSNLTTNIHNINFHPSSKALLFSSRAKKDALRIAHISSKPSSCRVFPNWPTSSTPLSYVNAVNFSPGGGFLAMGNDKGRVLLYKLNPWDSY